MQTELKIDRLKDKQSDSDDWVDLIATPASMKNFTSEALERFLRCQVAGPAAGNKNVR